MAHGYSVDLRERAVGYVHRGGTRAEACDIFQIGSATLDRWLRQHRTSGTLHAKKNGSRAWKLDHEAIVEYVNVNNDSTLQEIADHFGTVVSVIDYVLRKFKITRKKNHALRGTGRGKARSISG
jgi:transposase